MMAGPEQGGAALLDLIADDALLAERTGLPQAEVEAMRRPFPNRANKGIRLAPKVI
jgi:hypothetical protein